MTLEITWTLAKHSHPMFSPDHITTFLSVQSLTHIRLFATPWTAASQASLSITNSWSLLTHVHWVSDAIQPSPPCRPLLLPPSIFPSIRVFSNESVLRIRWPKYQSFSFSISPSNEYSGLISFRMDIFSYNIFPFWLTHLCGHTWHSLACSLFSILWLRGSFRIPIFQLLTWLWHVP